MKLRRSMVAFLSGLFLCVLLPANVSAREVEGVELSETISIEGVAQPLVLNGAGVRSKFFFDIYVGALYLPAKQSDAESILSASAANRIVMHFLYDEVPKKKLIQGWIDGFENNQDKKTFTALKPRLDAFNEMFTDLKKGDVVLLDYIPQTGTRVTMKGELKGTIKGADFNKALLAIWLGEDPVTGSLKDAMLGDD